MADVNANHNDFLIDLVLAGKGAFHYTAFIINASSSRMGAGSARAVRYWGQITWQRNGAGSLSFTLNPALDGDGNNDGPGGTSVALNEFLADGNWGIVEGLRLYYRTTAGQVDPDTETTVPYVDIDVGTHNPAGSDYDMKTNYKLTINSVNVVFS